MTSGFSFSVAGLMLKFLQYYGMGIAVGYCGHPNKADVRYDRGIHPTLNLSTTIILMVGINVEMMENGIKINM